jgi:hypothetical protein
MARFHRAPRLAHTGEAGKRRSCLNDLRDPDESGRKVDLLVICSNVEEVHGFRSHGLGRLAADDPDEFESCGPGLWWAAQFYAGEADGEALLVPMDSRTTASPTGPQD